MGRGRPELHRRGGTYGMAPLRDQSDSHPQQRRLTSLPCDAALPLLGPRVATRRRKRPITTTRMLEAHVVWRSTFAVGGAKIRSRWRVHHYHFVRRLAVLRAQIYHVPLAHTRLWRSSACPTARRDAYCQVGWLVCASRIAIQTRQRIMKAAGPSQAIASFA